MPRRSKRELERALDDVDEPVEGVAWKAILEYLDHVADHGATADLPAEYFGADDAASIEWGRWTSILPDPAGCTPPGVDVDELTPPEVFGLTYCGPDVRRGIAALRTARSRGPGGGHPSNPP